MVASLAKIKAYWYYGTNVLCGCDYVFIAICLHFANFLHRNACVLCTNASAVVRNTFFQSQIHQMSFGGRTPPGLAEEPKHSPDPSRGRGGMGIKDGEWGTVEEGGR